MGVGLLRFCLIFPPGHSDFKEQVLACFWHLAGQFDKLFSIDQVDIVVFGKIFGNL
jgi:hypothetical protein